MTNHRKSRIQLRDKLIPQLLELRANRMRDTQRRRPDRGKVMRQIANDLGISRKSLYGWVKYAILPQTPGLKKLELYLQREFRPVHPPKQEAPEPINTDQEECGPGAVTGIYNEVTAILAPAWLIQCHMHALMRDDAASKLQKAIFCQVAENAQSIMDYVNGE